MTSLHTIYNVDLMYFRVNGFALYLVDLRDDQDFESLRESSTALDTRGLLMWALPFVYPILVYPVRHQKKSSTRNYRLAPETIGWHQKLSAALETIGCSTLSAPVQRWKVPSLWRARQGSCLNKEIIYRYTIFVTGSV